MDNKEIRCVNCYGLVEFINDKWVNILGSSICSFADALNDKSDHIVK
jgi:hypothetical protein